MAYRHNMDMVHGIRIKQTFWLEHIIWVLTYWCGLLCITQRVKTDMCHLLWMSIIHNFTDQLPHWYMAAMRISINTLTNRPTMWASISPTKISP